MFSLGDYMKQVYILTKEQAEELKDIKARIISNVDIIGDLLKKEPIKHGADNDIWEVLGRIERHCWSMEDILESK